MAVPATRRTPSAFGGLAVAADGGLCVQCAGAQGKGIPARFRQWQVVVICPSRQLNFGDPTEATGTSMGADIDDVIAALIGE